MELLHVSHFRSLLLALSLYLSQCHGVASCLSLPYIVAGCLSPSLLVPWIYCMSFAASFGYWLSLTVSYSAMELIALSNCLPSYLRSLIVSSSSKDLLHVSYCFLCLLAVSHCLFQCHGVTCSLSISLLFAGFLSLSLPVQNSFCMSLTVSYPCWPSLTFSLSSIESVHGSYCLLWLLALCNCLFGSMELLHISHLLL